jgi:hypothetical protein
MARPETVLQRLRDRGFGGVAAALGRDTLARESFAVERIEPYLSRLAEPAFSQHIWTDDLTIGQVADAVAAAGGFDLAPDDAKPVRTALRRANTTLRHIRGITR